MNAGWNSVGIYLPTLKLAPSLDPPEFCLSGENLQKSSLKSAKVCPGPS